MTAARPQIVEGEMYVQPIQLRDGEFNHTPSLGELCKALASARAKFKPVLKTAKNPFYHSSYADLAGIVSATVDALSAAGLAVIQSPGHVRDAEVSVTTLLLHSSGEWVRTETSLPLSKPDAQGAGSAITYARRYAYQAILNVAADEDDDGNAATSDREPSKTTEKGPGFINGGQQRAFWAAVKQSNKNINDVTAYFKSLGIEKTGELKKKDFDKHMKWAVTPVEPDLTEPLTESVKIAEQKKWARFFSAAKANGISSEDCHIWIKEQFAKESMKELTKAEIDQLEAWIQSDPFSVKK